MAAAAKHLASVTLELGGKSPAIVADPTPRLSARRTPSPGASSSTPVRRASRPTTSSCRRDSGSRSSTVSGRAIERSYGPESGWATNPGLARLVDPGAFARVKGLVDDAVQRGAKVVVGGQANEPSATSRPRS